MHNDKLRLLFPAQKRATKINDDIKNMQFGKKLEYGMLKYDTKFVYRLL